MDRTVHNPASPTSHDPVRGRIGFDDRLLAEAVRWAEATSGPVPGAEEAAEAGRQAGGDLENRIVRRAAALPIAGDLREAIGQVRTATFLVILTAVVLSLLAGASAAGAALGEAGGEPVNVFWVLGSLLGVQSLLLLAWVGVMLLRPFGPALAVASLGGVAMSLGRRASRWLHKGRHHAAAIEANVAVQAAGPLGRWTFSAVSQGIWLTFNVGVLVLLVTLLTVRQYSFSWETTILTADSYVTLTRAMGRLPAVVGINTPSEEQIRDTRGPGTSPVMRDASEAWSGFVVGCMVMYGFAPRILLLALCLGERRIARRRFRLDTTRPGYLRLRSVLMPASESLGVVGNVAADHPTTSLRRAGAAAAAPGRPAGPPAIVGLELPRPPDPWPPRFPTSIVNSARWRDLGLVDGRDDRVRIVRQLVDSPTEPEALIVVCALTTTPDRGVGAYLAELAATLNRSPIVLLTSGEALRRRGEIGSLEERIADWRTIVERAGIAPVRILELDLDHITETSAGQLAALMGVEGKAAPPLRRIEAAFDLIVKHLEEWSGASESSGAGPTAAEQAELHRQIASLYRGGESAWRNLLHGSAEAAGEFARRLKSGEVAEQLKAGGERVVSLLPPRLKSSARWLAAGATAGALGCVAAAALLSPVAIGSLPIWAGIGAAIAGAASLRGSASKTADSTEPSAAACGFADALRAATLLSLLLETQGRGEAAITRILDASIPDENADGYEDPDTPQAARRWLDEVRHRLDMALAREVRS